MKPSGARFVFTAAVVLLAANLLFAVTLSHPGRFHADEAFFTAFARNAAVKGDWWLSGSLDKPPLSIYLNALSLKFFAVTTDAGGVLQMSALRGEWAVRLTGGWVTLLVVALTMRLARDLLSAATYTAANGSPDVARFAVPLVAAGLMLASPLTTGLGLSAFADMPMVCFGMAGWLLAVRRRSALAGVAIGLAVWAKPQGMLWLPLIVLFLLLPATMHSGRHIFRVRAGRALLKLCATFVAVLLLLLLWDEARPGASVLLTGFDNNMPLPYDGTGTALMRWLGRGAWIFGWPIMTIAVLAGTAVAAGSHSWRWRTQALRRMLLAGPRLYGCILLLWLLLMTLTTVIITPRIYDRYWLPLLPAICILLAVLLEHITRHRRGLRIGGAMLLTVLVAANRATVPSGAALPDSSGVANQEIEQVALFLQAQPVAQVVYDHWVGWLLAYYMDAWHDKRIVYYPSPDRMVAAADALDEPQSRSFVTTDDPAVAAWLQAWRDAGYQPRQSFAAGRFVVYTLAPP